MSKLIYKPKAPEMLGAKWVVDAGHGYYFLCKNLRSALYYMWPFKKFNPFKKRV